jgi:epoxyqueuosine reductase
MEPAFCFRRPGNLLCELALTREAFNQKFHASPVKRAKRRGYLRNVAVALGNSGNPGAIPTLAQALEHDPEPLVRGHAAWALGCLGAPAARSALENARMRESDPFVQDEIQTALGEPPQEGNPRDDIMH